MMKHKKTKRVEQYTVAFIVFTSQLSLFNPSPLHHSISHYFRFTPTHVIQQQRAAQHSSSSSSHSPLLFILLQFTSSRSSHTLSSTKMPSLPKSITALLAVFLLALTTQFDLNSADDGGGGGGGGLQFSITDAVDWSGGMSSAYDGLKLGLTEEEEFEDGDVEGERRSLFWRAARYYISYGALSANRVPCPPRSGRSYYTHNCFRARGPIRPYVRGCSAISRCRR